MILSMTGFGAAEACEGGVSYRVEIRSVNNRYFKSAIKLPEHLQRFEGDVDRLLRSRLGRGSVAFALRLRDDNSPTSVRINPAALKKYVETLEMVAASHPSASIDLAVLLEYPGVCEPVEMDEAVLTAQFRIVERLTTEAMDKLISMRQVEGQALERDLAEQCTTIRDRLSQIADRAPSVVEEYHKRLHTRVQQLLETASVELDQESLIREVAIFAERCDVNEELSRLASHLDQFAELCASPEEAGRKLDFLAQEMLREANTIGSKASDGQVSRHVVEIKAAIDRLKEQVQNIE